MTGLKYEDARVVDCRDLDRFAAPYLEKYDRTWRALDTGNDGYHNGSYAEANVEHGAEIEDDLDQNFTRWLDGGNFYEEEDDEDNSYSYVSPDIQHMLQWLNNLGVIPDGKYVVHLWW